MLNRGCQGGSKQKYSVFLFIFIVIIITILFNDFMVVLTGVQLTAEFTNLRNQLINANKNSDFELDLSQILLNWPSINKHLNKLSISYSNSVVAKKLIGKSFISNLKDCQGVADSLISNFNQRQIWLIMLQNSNELRASGGFMGSFALVTIDQGKVIESVVEDVYDADGQWRGFIEAPPGVKEYLSSGKGWHLPDANWSADFSQSAEQVKSFIEQSNNIKISHVVGINTLAASAIIDAIGPIYLSDYNLTLNAENMSTLLQSRPAEFFPGSRQKVHMLDQTKLQTLLKIKSLDRSAYQALYQTIISQLKAKNILFYSTDSKLQTNWISLGWAGIIPKIQKDTAVLGLVESNVGINKVNQWIDRQIKIAIDQKSIEIKLTFTNRAPTGSNENPNLYVNYQRLLLPVDWQIQSIQIDGKETRFDSNMTNSTSQPLLQEVGWLVVTPPQSNTSVVIKMKPALVFPKFLHLIKQSGIPSTIYTIESPINNDTFVLDQDLTVDISQFLDNATINP